MYSMKFLPDVSTPSGVLNFCYNYIYIYISTFCVYRMRITGEDIKAVMEYCVLPLASDFVHKNSPFVPSVLLYGGEANGKTLLVSD